MGKQGEGAWIEQQATAAAGKNHIRLINQAEIFHSGSWKKKIFLCDLEDFMTGKNVNVFREESWRPGYSVTSLM